MGVFLTSASYMMRWVIYVNGNIVDMLISVLTCLYYHMLINTEFPFQFVSPDFRPKK